MKKRILSLATATIFAISVFSSTIASGVTEPVKPLLEAGRIQRAPGIEIIAKGGKTYSQTATRGTAATKATTLNLESAELTKAEAKAKQEILTYLKSLEANRNFSGQVLVSRGGKIFVDRVYGYADYEKKIRPTTDTKFAIASVTKQFTAAAILQLMEENKLALDDKASKYLENIPHGDKVTIKQMLTHTSGLPGYNFSPKFLEMAKADPSFQSMMDLIKDQPLDFEPGTGWKYSNTGYLILGKIVEKLSGTTLAKYFEEHIYKAAGMEKTGPAHIDKVNMLGAKGYNGFYSIREDESDDSVINCLEGDGYLSSTVEDLYRWNTALGEGKIIKPESLELMFGKQYQIGEKTYYGFGWMLEDKEEVRFYHPGNTVGFTAQNSIYTKSDGQIILLTNKGYIDLPSIDGKLKTALDGKKLSPVVAKKKVKLTKAQKEKLLGTYEADGVPVGIIEMDGVFSVSIYGVVHELWAESPTKLYAATTEMDLKVVSNKKGKITGIKITANGQTAEFKRMAKKQHLTIPAEQLQKLEGTYEIKGVLTMKVFVEDGKLMVQGEGQPPFEVKASSATEFEASEMGIRIVFDSADTPKSFTMYQAGMEFLAEKQLAQQ